MARVFIGVGSNINPRANMRRALRRLAREVAVIGISTVYHTAPVGGLSRGKPDSLARSAEPALSAAKGPRAHQGAKHGPWFYNCVVEIATQMPPAKLRAALRRIEAELGRPRVAAHSQPRAVVPHPSTRRAPLTWMCCCTMTW
jgi:7,8-dihydro-6-hydroxymethylpterin-pyrophosphokinase